MSTYILYLFFFLATSCFSQTDITFLIENLDSITNNRVDWKATEKKTLSQKEKDIVRTILEDTSRFYCYESEYFDLYLNDFHFIDIDGDKDFDVIYNGRECPGYESESIHVYVNQKGKYNHSIRHNGIVLSIENNNLLFYEYPCCASIDNLYSNYRVQKDTVTLTYDIVFYTLSFKLSDNVYSNDFKQLININVDKGEDLCLFVYDTEQDDNDLYSKEKNCAIKAVSIIRTKSYSQLIDKHGINWQYVLVEKKDLLIEDNYLEKYAPQYLMLWVKD